MLLEKLVLHRFRSYHDIDLAFPAAGAYITGLNGSGKTNLLESIFFLANLSSFRTHNREELRNWDAAQGIVRATVADRHNRPSKRAGRATVGGHATPVAQWQGNPGYEGIHQPFYRCCFSSGHATGHPGRAGGKAVSH